VYNVAGFIFVGWAWVHKNKMHSRFEVAQESPQHHEDEEYPKWYKEKKRKDTRERVMQF
jgi:hypothetical protein